MKQAAKELVKLLSQRGMTVTTAESCTGGLISAAITSVPGSSAVLDGALVSYASAVKGRFLNVPPETLYDIGVVSAECAEAMAKGAAALFSADCAISVTGNAGPSAGDPAAPVGRVYIAAYLLGMVSVRQLNLSGNREQVRECAAKEALTLLCEKIREIVG